MKMEPRNKSIDKLYKRRSRIEMPDFQRDEVWNNEKKQKLIDTILKGWRIPKLYFKLVDKNELLYECVDGQQRLNAIFEFYEGKVSLPEGAKRVYGGNSYKTLLDEYSDKFDDYELQIDEIEDAEDDELEELYLRLQLGTPLNTAEKLNAVRGNLKDYIKDLSNSDFFKNSVGVNNTRYAHFAICSKMFYLAIYHVPGKLRQQELEKMLQENRTFSKKSEVAIGVKKILDVMHSIFGNDKKLLRNRANILSVFYFLLQFNSIDIIMKNIEDIKNFLYYFFESLQKEVEKGSKATNLEFINYQDAISRNTDSKESVTIRNSILINNLANYNGKLYALLQRKRGEKEDILIKRALEISEEILRANEDYIKKSGNDKFRITTEVFRIEKTLQKPATNKTKLGALIDFLYKLVYEGSAEGARLNKPKDNIIQDIKNIRTDLRHDWRHGKPSKIKSKSKDISESYKKYTGKGALNLLDSDDFILLQINLYADVIKFLKNE